MALEAAEYEEAELGTIREVLKKPRALKGIVGAVANQPRRMAAEQIDRVVTRTRHMEQGMDGAVDRAEEALRFERPLEFMRDGLRRGAQSFEGVWDSAASFLGQKSDHLGRVLQNARAAKENELAIRTGAKVVRFFTDRLEGFRDSLDRTRSA